MDLFNPKIDQYLQEGCMRCPLGGTPDCKVHSWQAELKRLREIVLDCGLTEELKWSVPCYTHNGKNVFILSAFVDYCAISFFKGALLKDPQELLVKPGENSQAARYLKFTSLLRINEQETVIRAFIKEAIAIEKAGLKVQFKKEPEPIPEEFQVFLDGDPHLKQAFESLTPGRKRGYILHFTQPKQSKTRVSRIEKCIPKILAGLGFHDR